MRDSPALHTRLRHVPAITVARAQEASHPADWLARGLPAARLHELRAAAPEDAAVAAGFGVALALAGEATPLLWLRTEEAQRRAGRLHAGGLVELGLDPAALVMAVVADAPALLRAAADAARCPGLGMLVVEAWGPAPGLDLTATRRLQLAAESSGAVVLLLRVAGGAPAPSAAATRWGVAACPSTALAADAPGRPAFHLELERRRGGPAGQRWRVEWDRDDKKLHAAPLPGAGLSLAADRAAARDAPAPLRRLG
ncbi:hypothetical protein [uncultured Sphingomonas sp.]|uniref:hypothetical protein n=1 Tax=uncultured Sphingomonas sp. TaxID=158754 RepID=UPI0035CA656F